MRRTALTALTLLLVATHASAQSPGTIYFRVGSNAYSVAGNGMNPVQLPLAVDVTNRPLDDVSGQAGYPVVGGRLFLSTDRVGTVANGGTTMTYCDVVATTMEMARSSRE